MKNKVSSLSNEAVFKRSQRLKKINLTENEFLLLVDINNGVINDYSFEYCKYHLMENIAFEEDYNVSEKYNVKIQDMLNKIYNLSYQDILLIFHEIDIFWHINDETYLEKRKLPPLIVLKQYQQSIGLIEE